MEDVLVGRLLAPRVPPHVVPRPRLVARLAAAARGRVATVVAGAGSGKSTLLAQALDELSGRWVWCSCDDRLDGASLVTHLRVAIAGELPGFGSGMGTVGDSAGMVAALCNEMALTLTEDLVVVLDDVHGLPPGAAAAVGLLARDAPPQVHLVLSGRAPLALHLARTRVTGCPELAAEDLAFDLPETAELFSRFGRPLSSADLVRVHGGTEGWVTGLVLAAQAPEAADAAELVADDRLFDYLAEEVLLAQPPALQRFLLDTSVLEGFTPAVATAVSGREDAAAVCADLVRRNLFTVRSRTDEGWFRYHHLFAAFLRRRAEEEGPGRVAALHRLAAAAWIAAGEVRVAVPHLLAAGDAAGAADLLATMADGMLMSHESAALGRWLRALPPDAIAARPVLGLAHATLTFQAGEHHAAFAALEAVLGDLIAAGDHDRAAAAFFRLIYMQLAGGTPQRHALEVGARQVPRIARDAAMLPACLVMLASELGCACRYAEAEEALGVIGTLSVRGIDPLGQAYVQSVRAMFVDHPGGRSERALDTVEWAIGVFDRFAAFDTLGYVLALRAYRAIILNHLGRFEDALQESVRMHAAAVARGASGAVARVATKVRAVALAGLERWLELEAELDAAEPWPALRGTSYAFRTRAPAARLAASRGDRAEVARLADEARDALREFGLSYDAPNWLCDLVACASDVGLTGLARELQADALAAADQARTPWARARAAVAGALAWCGEEEGERWLAEALTRTADGGMAGIWLRRDRRAASRLLPRAVVAELGPVGEAASLAVRCGAEVLEACVAAACAGPPAPRRALADAIGDLDPEMRRRLDGYDAPVARRRPPLRLSALGGFAVRRGDEVLPPAAFGRERARALLGAIACARGPVHRDRLLEWLWPELPLDRAVRAFGVTLHELRRALEPELPRGAAGSVIEHTGEAYRLALAADDTWDVARFMQLARPVSADPTPAARLARLRAAERAYSGPLYPEWPYAEWAAECRAEVEEAFREVEEALAASTEATAPAEAVERYRRLVQREPERERWHRGLMRAHAAAGDLALALRQYHACRAVLVRELGVEPAEETRRLYLALLAPDPADGTAYDVPEQPVVVA